MTTPVRAGLALLASLDPDDMVDLGSAASALVALVRETATVLR